MSYQKKWNSHSEEDETPISFALMHQASSSAQALPPNPHQRREPPIVIDCSQVCGAFLAKIRESRSLSVDFVSSKTRIPKKYILAIEADDSYNLPAPVYFRGFVVAYLREIGLSNHSQILETLVQLHQKKASAG